MAKGLPKSIIKKYGISKKAWSVYRGKKGRKPRSKSRRVTRRRKKRNNPVRRVRRTVRRRRRNRKGGSNLQAKVFKWLRIGMLVAPAARNLARPVSMEKKVWHMAYDYGGFDFDTGTWDIKRMAVGWGPFLGACLATYGIPKLVGLIRKF